MDHATRPASSLDVSPGVDLETGARARLLSRQALPPPPLDRETLLELLPIGVLVVDEALRVRLANSAGLGVLAHHDPLRVEDGRLTAVLPEQAASLQRLVEDGRLAPAEPGRLALSSQDGARRVVVTARLLEQPASAAGSIHCLAVSEERTPCSAALGGLSRRRREILERLLSGSRPEAIARSLGLSEHTVRAYIKDVYRHFGTHSRGELLSRFIQPSE